MTEGGAEARISGVKEMVGSEGHIFRGPAGGESRLVVWGAVGDSILE